MKKLLFVLLLTGCTPTYTKPEIDQQIQGLDKKIKDIAALSVNMHANVSSLMEYNFPQAMKVSKENNNCPVDLKTLKCVEIKGK